MTGSLTAEPSLRYQGVSRLEVRMFCVSLTSRPPICRLRCCCSCTCPPWNCCQLGAACAPCRAEVIADSLMDALAAGAAAACTLRTCHTWEMMAGRLVSSQSTGTSVQAVPSSATSRGTWSMRLFVSAASVSAQDGWGAYTGIQPVCRKWRYLRSGAAAWRRSAALRICHMSKRAPRRGLHRGRTRLRHSGGTQSLGVSVCFPEPLSLSLRAQAARCSPGTLRPPDSITEMPAVQ